MSSVSESRQTAYKEFVFSAIPHAVRDGAGLYNYQELAGLVGLKPTHNFRKRVRQLVAEGRLELIATFTPRGGIEARFKQAAEPLQMEFPF